MTGHTGCAMFSKMQMASSEMLHVNASVLVGLAAMVTMVLANPLKPIMLQFTSLANITNRDSDMFNLALNGAINTVVYYLCNVPVYYLMIERS